MKIVSFLLSTLGFASSMYALTLHQKEAIGNRIFINECSGKKELLVFWNPHEPFPSLGIGHCIWFPRSYTGKYTQTFPELMRFLKRKGIHVPHFATKKYCPWNAREDFLADSESRDRLRTLLSSTIELQTEFLILKLHQSKKHILAKSPPSLKDHISHMFHLLESTPAGMFALLDYLNFKGEGTNPAERYHAKGWGLTQVLSSMPQTTSQKTALSDFIHAAKICLAERVSNASPDSPDKHALKGWHARIDRYNQPW